MRNERVASCNVILYAVSDYDTEKSLPVDWGRVRAAASATVLLDDAAACETAGVVAGEDWWAAAFSAAVGRFCILDCCWLTILAYVPPSAIRS